MYAHDLRKWSLAKFLMFQWLPVLMLLVFWCAGAAGLHLTTFPTSSQTSNDNIYRFGTLAANPAITTTNQQNRNPYRTPQQIFNNNNGDDTTIYSNPTSHLNAYFENFHLQRGNGQNVNDYDNKPLTTMMGSRKLAKRIERVDDNFETRNRIRRLRLEKSILTNIETNDNNNGTNNDPQPSDNAPQTQWAIRLKEKRARNEAHRYRLTHNMSQTVSGNTPLPAATTTTTTSSITSTDILQQQSNSFTSAKLIANSDQLHNRRYRQKSFQLSGRNRRESRHENRQLQQHQQHQQQQQNGGRSKTRRFCTARDPATLAFEAPTVFEGKVRSMSSDRRRNFSVTFEVKEVYKRQLGYKLPLLVRLQFSYRNNSECDIYKETLKPRGYVREELEQGKLYILFVEQIDIGNYTILGQPIKKTRKAVNEVRIGVSEKYGQRASIESLLANYSTAREGRRIRIVCRVRGQPPPKVTWFKDNRSLSRNRSKYQFIHLRKRAELIIKSATKNDSGQYECRAKNKLARQPVSRSTRIEILPREYEVTTLPNNWTHSGSSCPVIGEFFCLNGGTCVFFKDVGEPACKCPDGFLGNRCETKNPTNLQPNPTHRSIDGQMVPSEIKTLNTNFPLSISSTHQQQQHHFQHHHQHHHNLPFHHKLEK